jgi:hypothetical protein
MPFAFGEGLSAGNNVLGQQQQQKNDALKAELDGKKLQLESAKLAQSEFQNRQKMAQDLFTQSVDTMKGIAETVKNMPQVIPGSAVDQALEQQKVIVAKLAGMIGQDPTMAQVMADTIRASAGQGIKPMGVSAGGAIVNPQTGQVLHQQPNAPQQQETVLRRIEGLKRMGINLTPEQIVQMSGGGQPAEAQTRFSPAGPYTDAQGNIIGEGVFDRSSGNTMLRVPGNPDPQPLPSGAKPSTETALSRNAMTGEQFTKLAGEVEDTERSLRQVERYFKSVDDADSGWKVLADKFTAQMKTIFKGDLTPQQFNTLKQNGQLQGLLGQFRKEVVGGGVMTEQDALRVLNALGGDMSVARNPEVVAELLKDIVKDKIANYENVQRPTFNAQLKAAQRGEFKEKQKIELDPDRVFATKKQTGGAPGDAGRFGKMKASELSSVDPNSLSEEELNAWRAAADAKLKKK